MASIERPGLLSFATLQMPAEPTGAYQTVGLLLKIAGWVRLVLLLVTAVVGVIALAMLAFVGALGGMLSNWFLGPFGGFGGLAAGIVLVVAAIVLVFIVAFHAAMTYWTSWLYARWVAKDPRAVQHLFTYALVTTILAGLGALGALGGNPSGLVDVGLLVVGIMLLVNAQSPEIKAMGTGGQWKPVE